MRLRLDGDRLVVSDREGVKVYDLGGVAPALMVQVGVPALANPFAEHRDGEQISEVRGGVFARMFTTPEGDEHWVKRPSHVTLFDLDLTPVATYVMDRRLNDACLALSPDGASLASVAYGGGVVAFEARTGRVLREAPGDIASGTSWSPDGRMIAAGDTDQGGGELYVLELSGEEALVRHALPAPTSRAPLYDSPYASAWSPDGAVCAISCGAWSKRGVTVYDVAERVERWAVCYDMEVDEEDTENWEALDVAFVAGGAVVIAGVEGDLKAWRAADGAELSAVSCEGASSSRYVADEARRCIWYDCGGEPARADYPEDWC